LTENTEILPNIQFDADGKLHPDSAAAAAIQGLPSCKLANRMVDLEGLYEAFMWKRAGKRTLRSRLAWWIAGPALRIIRTQVSEMTTANQELLLKEKSQGVAHSFGAEYHRMAEDMRGFRAFLQEYFDGDLQQAVALNTPLLDLAKQLLLRGR
jgi:hypothetical protein